MPRLMIHALLALVLLPAGAAWSDPPGFAPAPDSLRTRWAGQVRTAAAMDVRHSERRRRVALFTTRRPCEYEYVVEHAREHLAADPGLTEMLATLIAGAPNVSLWRTDCPESTEDRDDVAIAFVRDADTVAVSYSPLLGSAFVSSGGKFASYHEPRLTAELARLLPDDPRIASIEPCPARPAVASRPGDFADEHLPEATKRVPPDYPDRSRERNEEGLVVVAALVDTTGRVARTIVKKSDRSFDESAVLAVEQWHFRPARSKGRAIAVWVAVPVRFSMH